MKVKNNKYILYIPYIYYFYYIYIYIYKLFNYLFYADYVGRSRSSTHHFSRMLPMYAAEESHYCVSLIIILWLSLFLPSLLSASCHSVWLWWSWLSLLVFEFESEGVWIRREGFIEDNNDDNVSWGRTWEALSCGTSRWRRNTEIYWASRSSSISPIAVCWIYFTKIKPPTPFPKTLTWLNF